MTDERSYPAGVPCWIDTEQPDVDAARHFYAGLFGWEMAGVPADRIETGTFGTDRFMCNPSTEQCLQREGRVEVLVRASS